MTEQLRIITTKKMDQEFMDYLQAIRNRDALIVTDENKPRPLRARAFAEFMAITKLRNGVQERMSK